MTTPDLYNGHRFTTIEEGMAFYRELTHEQVLARAQAAAAALTGPFVVAGVSLGAMVAQTLAQTDARVQGLLALIKGMIVQKRSSCVPVRRK